MRRIGILLCALALAACGGGRRSARVKQVDGRDLVGTAAAQKGTKYRLGGASPQSGFDCSGLVWWVHRRHGLHLPRSSYKQYRSGRKIKQKALRRGDLVFFRTYKRGASHVGIYAGGGTFWHAPSSGRKVSTASLSNPYWKKRYLGARRYW